MKMLVVGGAGYIGSHILKLLEASQYEFVTLDNLSSGYRDAVQYGRFIQGDLEDIDFLHRLFAEERFTGVFHFASNIQVGESVLKPSKYYRNNVVCTLNLLDAMLAAGVNKLVFSSSAAVYGTPNQIPIDEDHPLQPLSPYGKSKLMVESILEDFYKAYDLNSVSLRYFNAAGASSDGNLGERHDPETHLIPLLLQAASGRRESITIYGKDYATTDGTCIRDYIHVEDLCTAHLLAMEHLLKAKGCDVFNLGSGKGFSVQQVIHTAKEVTQSSIYVKNQPRREGDPSILVANANKAQRTLGWKPKKTQLTDIIIDAWHWEKKMCDSHTPLGEKHKHE